MKKLRKKIIIFDVDGVLIDSKKNMESSWKKVQKVHCLKDIGFEEYFRHIGRPFFDILNKIGINKNYHKIKKTYDKESLRLENQITNISNVANTLTRLKNKNFILNIVTSKDIKRTKQFLSKLEKFFTLIECSNNKIKGKPHPDQINRIIYTLKAKKSECVYIGDTNIDYQTAKNSGIDFIFAKWGYGMNYNYKYKIDNIKDLENSLRLT